MNLQSKPQLPSKRYPICIVGGGSIVRDAHLPAYRLAGFEVVGIVDVDEKKAERLASEFEVGLAFGDINDALASVSRDVIWDVAVPASQITKCLEVLPDGAFVLIQKPMGDSIKEAQKIVDLCHRKRLNAAVNLQLRFAPFVLAAQSLIERGVIGELYDMEARIIAHTPFDHFPFLKAVPRMEIQYFSIHFIDCIRSFLGNPDGVYAKSVRHPDLMDMKESRSVIIMDYGERVRANIHTNHSHKFGQQHQESFIKWEGSKGAIKAKMGLLMNYPEGVPDCFEYTQLNEDGSSGEWKEVKLDGSWFPEAFIGSMSQVMRLKAGDSDGMPTSVEDAIYTMACCEAAYESSAEGGVAIDQFVHQN